MILQSDALKNPTQTNASGKNSTQQNDIQAKDTLKTNTWQNDTQNHQLNDTETWQLAVTTQKSKIQQYYNKYNVIQHNRFSIGIQRL